MDAVIRPFAYSSLVARLDRLEKGIQILQEMVRALSVQTEKRAKPPAKTPPGRTGS
jgi:hypothetical protein